MGAGRNSSVLLIRLIHKRCQNHSWGQIIHQSWILKYFAKCREWVGTGIKFKMQSWRHRTQTKAHTCTLLQPRSPSHVHCSDKFHLCFGGCERLMGSGSALRPLQRGSVFGMALPCLCSTTQVGAAGSDRVHSAVPGSSQPHPTPPPPSIESAASESLQWREGGGAAQPRQVKQQSLMDQ